MFKLPEDIRIKVQAMREAERSSRAAFAALSNNELAIAASHWMAHCDAPKKIKPDEMVYDSTFWHAIVPVMIERLKDTKENTNG